jgi:hypothetical protein
MLDGSIRVRHIDQTLRFVLEKIYLTDEKRLKDSKYRVSKSFWDSYILSSRHN